MTSFEAMGQAIAMLTSSWDPWIVVVPGLLIGLFGAALPGISGSLTMALCLPFTLHMDFLTAMMFLTSVYTGGGFGGAVPAILINIPGTPAAVATAFDGYPMARVGRHNEALGLGLCASVCGMILSYLMLIAVVSPMASMVLKLGPTEMLFIVLWGLTLIATLRGGSITKGLIAGLVGLLIGSIGIGTRGDIRGTMGFDLLLDGVPSIPAMLGLFAAAELFNTVQASYLVEKAEVRRPDLRGIWSGVVAAFRYPATLVRGSLLGAWIGALPGVGAAVANLVSYSDARRRAGNPDSFGKGDPRGVVAAESADSSAEGGAMATLLALGLPGGGATAVLLGAFAMHNINGGPRFLSEQSDLVYAILLGAMSHGFILLPVGIAFIYMASALVKIPNRLLVPAVIVLSIFGTFAMTGTMMGPIVLTAFALLGWLMTRHDYPVAAMVIGILLSRVTEGNLLRVYQLSGGEPSFLLSRPIALLILTLLVLSLAYPHLRRWRRSPRRMRADQT